jgi:hypothetical protein
VVSVTLNRTGRGSMLCSTGGATEAPDVVVVMVSPPFKVVQFGNDNLVFLYQIIE